MKMAGSFSMLLSLLLVFHLTNSIFSQGTRGAVDLTLKAGEIGEDVVDASILKINLIGDLFENDYDFMKRIAFVESRFGTNRTVMSMFPDRGIWQVASRMQRYILSHEKTTGLLNRISQFFGDEITNMTSDNFSIPIRSAIASRLFIDLQLGNSSFPATLSDQARWWSTNYHPGGRAGRFLSAVREHETNHSCSRPPLDVWFLVDNSRSLNTRDLRQTLTFVDQLSSEFTISPNRDRTGLMLFARHTILVSDFSQHQSNEDFSNAVRGANRALRLGTRTGNALKNTLIQGFNVRRGARPLSDGIPRILIVITDGKSNDVVTKPAEELKAVDVTIFSIGIGRRIDNEQLNEIASDPDSEYAFRVRNFNNLLNVLRRRMITLTCNLPRTLSNNSNVVFQLDPRNPSYAALKIERDASSGNDDDDDDVTNIVKLRITLTAINPNASGQVYISSTYPQPNAALHDLSISLTPGKVVTVQTTVDESTSNVNLAFIANDNPFRLRVTTINHRATVKINKVTTTTTKLVTTTTTKPTTTTMTQATNTTTTPAVTEPTPKTPEVVATPDSGKDVTTSSRASITADPPIVSGSETTADDITVASRRQSGDTIVTTENPVVSATTSDITVSETETTSGTSRKSLAIGSLWLSTGILVKLFCEQLGL